MMQTDEAITFVKDNQEFRLDRSKVNSIDVVTGKNLKSELTSGAIAGKFVLGGLSGAVIGSIANTSLYLVMSYDNDGEYKEIIFDTELSSSLASKMTKKFKKNNVSETKRFDL